MNRIARTAIALSVALATVGLTAPAAAARTAPPGSTWTPSTGGWVQSTARSHCRTVRVLPPSAQHPRGRVVRACRVHMVVR